MMKEGDCFDWQWMILPDKFAPYDNLRWTGF